MVSITEADCDIVQISAWCGEQTMMTYVMPTKRIHPQAAKVNKIEVRDGKMYHSGEPVEALDRRSALLEFAQFITDLGPDVVLLAHNGARFDFPRYAVRHSQCF